MGGVQIDARSEPVQKALLQGNSQNTIYSTSIVIRSTEPTDDGIWDAGHGGIIAPNRLFLMPYCEGPANARFGMRVYGWQSSTRKDSAIITWIPFLLAEYLCTSCERFGVLGMGTGPGAMGSDGQRFILNTEKMCDTIQQTRGNPEPVSSPGGNMTGFTFVGLDGCRKFQFDFSRVDFNTNISMNCLWSRS